MGRPDRPAWLPLVILPLLLACSGTWPATAVAGGEVVRADDALEPAKAAIRIKDYEGAARLLSEQVAHDDADAQYLLGSMMIAGLVPAPDHGQPRRLFESAAGNGQAQAALALSALLATGDPSDREGARRWLERAAALGDPSARDLLQRGVLPLEPRPQEALADESSLRLELWRAARRGDIQLLEALATQERVNAADDFGRTALHHAADGAAVRAISLLIARGAKVDAADQYGVTPLMLACAAESPGACTRLLEAKASVTTTDRGGNTALAYATRSGRTQQARDLRAAGSAPVRTPVATGAAGHVDRLPRAPSDAYAGWPDVAVAATRKDPARLRDLLARGADPNGVLPDGQTVLIAAVASDSGPSVAALIAAGASLTKPDAQGATPVQVAVRLGHASALDVLLDHGADPNAPGPNAAPPLIVAVENGDLRSVRRLLAAGADPNARSPAGGAALAIAAARDHSEIVKQLLDARAAVSAADASGRTPLWLAACADAAATVPVLVKAGAAVDAADALGVTPLACAAARGHTAMVDRLVRAGASVAARARSGDTPLSFAAMGGHASTVRRLLAAGAEADARNRFGDTPLILASQSGSVESVQALLGAGANRNLRNRDGVAASDAAQARNFDGVVVLLDR
jgi:ankyrin repeat protein